MDNKSCKVLMGATTTFTVRLSNLIGNLNTLKKKRYIFAIADQYGEIRQNSFKIHLSKYWSAFERARFANFNNENMKNFNVPNWEAESHRPAIEFAFSKGKIEERMKMVEKLQKETDLGNEKISELSGFPMTCIENISLLREMYTYLTGTIN